MKILTVQFTGSTSTSDVAQWKPPVSTTEDNRLDALKEEGPSCKSGANLLPHKTNCNAYYQCVNGVALQRNCPTNTVFVPEVSTVNSQFCHHGREVKLLNPYVESFAVLQHTGTVLLYKVSTCFCYVAETKLWLGH